MMSTPRYGQYPKWGKSTFYPDLNNVHSTLNPLSGIVTHYIQIQTISQVQQINSMIDPDTVSSSLLQKFKVAVLRYN